MQPRFISRLQELRSLLNRPIEVTSGLRCLAHNERVGGAKNSRHLIGAAADLAVVRSADRYEMVALAMRLGFHGIGVARNFVHVDLREKGPVLWTY